MIAFRGVTAGGFHEASFSCEPGAVCRLLTASEADTELFMRLLSGTVRPEAGEILLFGRELGRLAEHEALALYARMGFAWSGGGCVSNLKVWENILLPLWYHGDRQAADREPAVVDLLVRLGLEPGGLPAFLQGLPGGLGRREKRFVGLVRAMMQEPEIIIYEDPLEGLDGETRGRLGELAGWFHARTPGRTSIFVADSEQGLPALPGAISLRQDGDGRVTAWG